MLRGELVPDSPERLEPAGCADWSLWLSVEDEPLPAPPNVELLPCWLIPVEGVELPEMEEPAG